MTLLERWDEYGWRGYGMKKEEIRRALAIAQAVEELMPEADMADGSGQTIRLILRRADELLAD